MAVGCSSGGSSATPSTPAGAAVTTTAGSPAPGSTAGDVTMLPTVPPTAAPSPNTFQVKATGAYSLDVSGTGAYCNYFVPGAQAGLVYSVSSTVIGQTGWDLHVQGNSPAEAGVLLNTDVGSFANDAALSGGVVNAHADLHHADFDLDLVNVTNVDQVVHLSGSIDCP